MPLTVPPGLLRSGRRGYYDPPAPPVTTHVFTQTLAGNWGIAVIPGHADTQLYVERTGASATTLCGSGDPAGTIRHVPTGANFTVASDAARPTYVVSGGLHSLVHDGVNNRMVYSVGTTYTGGEIYAVAALRRTGTSGSARVLGVTSGSQDDWSSTLRAAPVENFAFTQFYRNAFRTTSVAFAVDQNGVFEAFCDATSAISRINNDADRTGSFASLGNYSVNTVTLGSLASGGDIGPLTVYGFLVAAIPLPGARAALRTAAGDLAGLAL